MNPEQILDAVETAIRERPQSPELKYVICWLDNKIQCVPMKGLKDDGNIFWIFFVDEVDRGFTNAAWDQIKRKIHYFFNEVARRT